MILKTGVLAYYDGHGPVGLIPCKVLSVTSDKPEDQRPGSWQQVRAEVTKDHQAWKKGEVLEGWGLHFIPRGCVHGFHVRPYRVEADGSI